MWPDAEAHKSTHRDTEDGKEVLGQKNRKVGQGSTRHKNLYLCHHFPKGGTPLHPNLKQWGDTDSPRAGGNPTGSAQSAPMRLLFPEAPESWELPYAQPGPPNATPLLLQGLRAPPLLGCT